ncbi:TPA: hypothetical protein HA338_00130 [Methanosarcina acetivorans]|nr:hypothetical protein [Methanosarcina acetivorans]HIH92501.1 hypothetical protein [Methanosarcina acetivorans]
MKVNSTIVVLAAFLALAAFSAFLVFAEGNSIVETSKYSGAQLDEIASDDSSLKAVSGIPGNNIIQKIEVQDSSLEFQEYWDGFETVTIDVQEFENAAANGNVHLRLLERDFEIEIEDISRLNGGKSYRYSGYVKGIPDSRATFYVCGELFSGSVEFEDLMYNIAVTSETYNGKTVHTVFVMDWKKDRERLVRSLNPLRFIFISGSAGSFSGIEEITMAEKRDGKAVHLVCRYYSEGIEEKLDQEFSSDLLQFFLIYDDKEVHEICIEILDFYNESIFHETYSLSPGTEISSPELGVDLGVYRYELTLDGNFAFEQKVRADHASGSGSSEKLCICLIDHPGYPLAVGIEST